MADLTTIARFRAYLGQEYVTKDDALLQSLVTSSSAFFEREVGRTITVAEYTETVDGNGTNSMTLRAAPIVQVTSVTVDGVLVPQRASWDGTGWVLQGSWLRLVGYYFSEGISNVTVVYSAGYAVVPDDIQMAVCELANLKRTERDRPGIFSRTEGGSTGFTQFQVISIPVGIQRVIDNYRLPGVV